MLALLAFLAVAAAESPQTEVDLFNLEQKLEVSVRSATLGDLPIEDSPAVISVFTEDQIRALGLQTLRDALRLMAGVTVLDTQLGEQRIGVRGVASAPNVLVTLDGERLNGFYDGSLPLDLRLFDVERIEVIRGPASALYGTNAFSAVISIFTRRRDGLEGSAAGEALFDHHVGGSTLEQARLASTSGAWQFRGSLSAYDSTGPRALVTQDTTLGAPYSKIPGITHMPRLDLQAGIGIERRGLFAQTDSLELRSEALFERRGPYFGLNRVFAPDGHLEHFDFLNHLDYRLEPTEGVRLQVRALFSRRVASADVQDFPNGYVHEANGDNVIDPGELFPDGKRRSYQYTSYSTGLSPMVSLQLPRNRLTLGADVEYDWLPRFDYSQNYRNDLYVGPSMANHDDLPLTQRGQDRLLVAGYAQDEIEILKSLSLTLGAHYDRFSDVGGAFNPRAAIVWRPIPRLAAKLLYGHAFRAPTFQELYDHTSTSFTQYGQAIVGSEVLQPETTNTYEAAVEVSPVSVINLRLNGFYIRTSGAIGPSATFGEAGATLVNYPGLRIFGNEAEAQLLFGPRGYALINASWFYSNESGDGLPGYQRDSNLRFLSTTMRDLPRGRANAAVVLTAASWVRIGATYSFTSVSDNNQRTVYEAINQYHRPAWHELSLNALFPLAPQLELGVRATAAPGRTIPVPLPSGSYALPDGPAASLLISLRGTR